MVCIHGIPKLTGNILPVFLLLSSGLVRSKKFGVLIKLQQFDIITAA